jgi:thiosulfate dehydrogenase
MNKTLIRRHLLCAVVAPAFVLPAALLAGCAQESTPPAAPVAASAGSPSQAAPVQPAVQSGAKPAVETVQVGACDGGAPVKVAKGLTGQALADSLLDQWQRSHPEANWVAEEKERHLLKPPADNSPQLHGGQGKGDTYGSFTQRDLLTWNRETEKFVAEGSRIFHNADELGSTVAVSCDMCHPHAANTHPETYPKFQTQLGRVVLLRDMINWCVQNPVRGEKLAPDGPVMRALEAYIQAQRKGVAMDYGRH